MSTIEESIKRILIANPNGHFDFAEKFIEIERLGINNPQFSSFDYTYKIPASKARMDFSCKDGELSLLYINGQTNIAIGSQNTTKEKYEKSELINKNIKEERVGLSPEATPIFLKEIMKIKKGQILDLNMGLSLLCTKDDDNSKELKEVYNGSIINISIKDFNRAEVYNLNNKQDLQYLYSKAYRFSTGDASIRIHELSENGKEIVNAAEKRLKEGVALHHIGRIELRLAKNGTQYKWYDENGDTIPREDVELIYAWAKHSSAEIEKATLYLPGSINITTPQEYETKFLQTVKHNALTNNFDELMQSAFEYSQITGGYSSITLSGLQQSTNPADFDMRSYVFSSANGINKIYEVKYTDNDFSKLPESITEIPFSKFKNFCIEKYKEPFISLPANEFMDKNTQKNILLKMQKEGNNPIGLNNSDINSINNSVETLLKSFERQKSAAQTALSEVKKTIEDSRQKIEHQKQEPSHTDNTQIR